jgi:ATP-binding cassette, subfamily G (WHITE), member 2, PDR
MVSGITIAFWIGFLAWFLYMTERGHDASGGATQLIFKRGAKILGLNSASQDEEKGSSTSSSVGDGAMVHAPKGDTKEALPASRGIFSWHHLNYEIVVQGGETRRLLDDVSGYVVPGKLVRFPVLFGCARVDGRLRV